MGRADPVALLSSGVLACLSLGCDPTIIIGLAQAGGDASAPGMQTPADADSDAALADCPGASSPGLVCQGFESTDLGVTRLDDTRGATLSLDSDTVHQGSGALRFTANASESWSAVVYSFPPVTSGVLYARAHYYIPAGSVTGRINLMTLESEQAFNVDVNVTSALDAEAYLRVDASRYNSAPGVIPLDTWFCLQAALDIDDTGGALELLVDGTSVLVTPRDKDTLPPSGVNEAEFGILWTEAGQTASELYVDDVAIDTEPVSCL
jgi:hypothetical protein